MSPLHYYFGAKSSMGANDFRIFKCIIQGYKKQMVGLDAQVGNELSFSKSAFQNLEFGTECGIMAQSLKIESSYFELLSTAVRGVLWGTVFSKSFVTAVTKGVFH